MSSMPMTRRVIIIGSFGAVACVAAPAVASAKPSGTYLSLGVAPGASIAPASIAFHPNVLYDAELGMAWEHGNRITLVGADFKLSQYFGRKRPGGGVDVVVSRSLGPVYAKAGLGAVTGIPRSAFVDDYRPAVGGVVGVGLQGRRRRLVGRIGVDYDARLDTGFRVNHTVMVSVRFVFGL